MKVRMVVELDHDEYFKHENCRECDEYKASFLSETLRKGLALYTEEQDVFEYLGSVTVLEASLVDDGV